MGSAGYMVCPWPQGYISEAHLWNLCVKQGLKEIVVIEDSEEEVKHLKHVYVQKDLHQYH